MIRRLDKLVFRDTLLTALVAVLGITFLFTALGLYQIVNQLQVTPRFSTLLSFAPALWASLMPFSVPVSVLFAASLVFGRMRADKELLLLAASGVAPWRPFAALVPVGIIAAGITGWAVSELGPQAYVDRHSQMRLALADFVDHPPQGPRELRFPGSGSSIDLSYSAVRAGYFEDLRVMVYSDQGLMASLSALRARIQYQRTSRNLLLTSCIQARLIQFDPLTGAPAHAPLVAERINELRVPFDFGSEDEPDSPKALGTLELLQRAQAESGTRSGASGEAVRRSGLGAAALLLPLLGGLLAALVNHPNRLFALGVGVVPSAILYFPVMMAMSGLARSGTLHFTVAAAGAPAAALLACAILLHRHWRSGWA